jgi:hypothetical protein
MASTKWVRLPGGRWKRWKKSRSDDRPGVATTWFVNQVPPHWYRNVMNRRERRRLARALFRGEAHAGPYVHPRVAAWHW